MCVLGEIHMIINTHFCIINKTTTPPPAKWSRNGADHTKRSLKWGTEMDRFVCPKAHPSKR